VDSFAGTPPNTQYCVDSLCILGMSEISNLPTNYARDICRERESNNTMLKCSCCSLLMLCSVLFCSAPFCSVLFYSVHPILSIRGIRAEVIRTEQNGTKQHRTEIIYSHNTNDNTTKQNIT
jgi:hypothetical protein